MPFIPTVSCVGKSQLPSEGRKEARVPWRYQREQQDDKGALFLWLCFSRRRRSGLGGSGRGDHHWSRARNQRGTRCRRGTDSGFFGNPAAHSSHFRHFFSRRSHGLPWRSRQLILVASLPLQPSQEGSHGLTEDAVVVTALQHGKAPAAQTLTCLPDHLSHSLVVFGKK